MERSEEPWSSIRDCRIVYVPDKMVTTTLLDGTSITTIADSYTMHLKQGWVNLHKDDKLVYSRRLDDIQSINLN